jgi:hypothetical protein
MEVEVEMVVELTTAAVATTPAVALAVPEQS